MSNQDGIISAPISLVGDVDYVLGTSLGDVVGVCESANVNKWSLHKPVRKDQIGELSSFESQDGNYGLHLEAFSSLANAISGWESQWTRLAPRAGQDWHRLTDFDGYDHYAQPQYYDCYRVLGLTNSVRIGINWSGNLQATEIPFRLIKPDGLSWALSQCYFGVILVGNGNTLLQCKQSLIDPDGSGYQEEVTIDTTNFPTTATYTPYPVLVYTTQPSRYASLAALGSGDRIISLPISIDEISSLSFKKDDTNAYGYMDCVLESEWGSLDRSGPKNKLYGTLKTIVSQGDRAPNWSAKVTITVTDSQGHRAIWGNLEISQALPQFVLNGKATNGIVLNDELSYQGTMNILWGNGTTKENMFTVMPYDPQ